MYFVSTQRTLLDYSWVWSQAVDGVALG